MDGLPLSSALRRLASRPLLRAALLAVADDNARRLNHLIALGLDVDAPLTADLVGQRADPRFALWADSSAYRLTRFAIVAGSAHCARTLAAHTLFLTELQESGSDPESISDLACAARAATRDPTQARHTLLELLARDHPRAFLEDALRTAWANNSPEVTALEWMAADPRAIGALRAVVVGSVGERPDDTRRLRERALTPLVPVATEAGNHAAIRLLAAHLPIATLLPAISTEQPVSLAARRGHAECIRALIDAGFSPRATATRCPLADALVCASAWDANPSHHEAVSVLLGAGASPDEFDPINFRSVAALAREFSSLAAEHVRSADLARQLDPPRHAHSPAAQVHAPAL